MRFFSRNAGQDAAAPAAGPSADGGLRDRDWQRPSGPATVAILTMARDEGAMLGSWVRHHAALVGADNLLILDDNSADGSTRGLPCTVQHLPSLDPQPFERTRMRLLSGFAAGLLHAYDYVVALDADEFLVIDPAFGTLAALLEARDYPAALGVLGLNVVHTPGEAPLDLDAPLLAQRAHAIFAPVMCKPAIKRTSARWALASHGLGAPYAPDPAALMFHFKFADRDRVQAIAAVRHELFLATGRAKASSWSREPDDIVAALDEAVQGLDQRVVPDFDATAIDLASLVLSEDGVHRSPRQGQLESLRRQPPVRIPDRLRGLA